MFHAGRLSMFWMTALMCLPAAVAAQAPAEPTHELLPVPQEDAALELFELDSQLQQAVVSSTKTKRSSAQAPAVVSVISGEQIRIRGYQSLAEVLRSVPGFYDVFDLVTHNVGVRGISGGARASGNVIKLMIDGHAVDYRPTTGNFFGEELIPLAVVDRVEIIRGPASALYGANAFLGVVNVITRKGADLAGVYALGEVNTVRLQPGYAAGFTIGAGTDRVDIVLSARQQSLNRSGLSLPASSPRLEDPRFSLTTEDVSRADRSTPRTLFGAVELKDVANGRLRLMASVQNLDARGAFQDLAPLSETNRIAAVNQNYRMGWSRELGDTASLEVSAYGFLASPTANERIDAASPGILFLRSAAANGFGVEAESRLQPLEPLSLVFGADYVQEHHLLQTFDTLFLEDVRAPDGTVIRPAGTIVPGQAHGAQSIFRNFAGFAQAIWSFTETLSATAGARVDQHNIYGFNPSGRLGLVYASPDNNTSLKALYGSSFKAPSAEQLYTQPVRVLDIQGNPELRAQRAHTFELSGGRVLLGGRGEVLLNLFLNNVIGRVEFVQRGLYLQARNQVDEWVTGGELDARVAVLPELDLRFSAGVAKTLARSENSVVAGQAAVEHPLFPPWQLHLVGDYRLPWEGTHASAEVSVIGPRESSQSSALIAGEAYSLPPYLYTAASISKAGKFFGDRATTVTLRVTNLTNHQWAEPGFGGIDVPAQGLTAFLSFNQQL